MRGGADSITMLFNKSENISTYSMYYKESDKINDLAIHLRNVTSEKNIVIVCIGTDRCIGDCVAPIVGTILIESGFRLPVYGTLHEPIHALNIREMLAKIEKDHNNPFIIGIDACLGDKEDIGIIRIRNDPIAPGSGKGENLPNVGNISIIGIVHEVKDITLFTESGIRLSFVNDMARVIARILIQSQLI
jgi:putative sporulation protein YyaC